MLSDLRECVSGETLVMLADGTQVPIRDLVGQTPSVLSMTEDRQIIQAQADLVWSVGIKPVFKVKLESGRSLRATGNHRFCSASGWKQVSELRAGDSLLGVGQNSTFTKNSLIIEDRIVSIIEQGQDEVFDLTVPETASWLANGIVSHNSGAIEQDADMVCFIYRDEVYNKETEDKGIAELIVAKHRAGETDTIRLAWLAEYTLFANLAKDTPGAPIHPNRSDKGDSFF